MRELCVLVTALVVLVGCADRVERGRDPNMAGPRAGATSGADGESTEPLRRANLEFEIDGTPFPSPLLRATIGGRTTWLVVDTGANHHALAGWLVRDLGLSAVLAEPGRDHIGRELRMSRTERITVAANGFGIIANQPLLVADVPDQLRQMDLGGFLSPQFLARDASERVILDLARAELRVASKHEAARSLLGRGVRIFSAGAQVCGESDLPHRSFVLPARIEGEAVQLLVDTGANRTSLRASSAAGAKLIQRANPWTERVLGVAGVFEARTLPDTRVQVGAMTATAEIEIVPSAPRADCPFDGVLGMDLLRSCILTLGDGNPDGRCEPRY